MSQAIIMGTPGLSKRAARWQTALRSGVQGPMLIAREIVDLGREWSHYASEADGASCTTWLGANVGHGLAWFAARAHAAERIGDIATRLHHETAVWLCNQTRDEALLKQCAERLYMAQRRGRVSGLPLDPQRARGELADLLGRAARPKRVKTCPHCGFEM